jgi:NADH dehydrogenase
MTTVTARPKLVTVFGGSGFLGRHVVAALARRGYLVRVAVRRPDLAGFVQPAGNVGQVMPVQANLRVRWSVDRAVQGADAIVNLVGILYEGGRQRFDAVQGFGARAVAEAARAANASLVHVSAIGADAHSPSGYARSKAAGEQAVLETVPSAVVIRPSILFGPEDGFFNKFAEMARFSPFLPLVGGGRTKFQPAYVADVAEAIARAVDGKVEGGRVYELGGPEVLSFRECMERMLEVIDRKRILLPIPWWAASLMGSVLGLLPKPVLTADQVKLLKADNVVSEEARSQKRDFAAFGISPRAIGPVLPSYLWSYRPAGQFTKPQNG